MKITKGGLAVLLILLLAGSAGLVVRNHFSQGPAPRKIPLSTKPKECVTSRKCVEKVLMTYRDLLSNSADAQTVTTQTYARVCIGQLTGASGDDAELALGWWPEGKNWSVKQVLLRFKQLPEIGVGDVVQTFGPIMTTIKYRSRDRSTKNVPSLKAEEMAVVGHGCS